MPAMSVCLLARLLKNACMNSDWSESNTLVISSPQPSDWLLRQFQATIERELRLSVKVWQAAVG